MPETTAEADAIPAPILIVDDRPENRLALKALLQPLGQPLIEAASGDEALRRLLDARVAVILMDVQMPGLDGLETAAIIRSRKATSHIPIIFITALSRETNFVMRGYAEGAVDYLLKPVDPDILRAKVKCFVDLYIRGELLVLRERELVEKSLAEAEARRATQLEQQVSAMVSHDLRSPLAIVKATAQLGARTSQNCSHHEKLFARILGTTNRLEKLTNDLLDFARARLGRPLPLNRKVLCLSEFTRRLLEDFQTVHRDRTFELSAPESLEGCWDESRIAQVLENLLGNALKYGKPTSSIHVLLRRVEDHAELIVENDGEQIPPHRLSSLFDPLTRLDEANGDGRNLGLGLFIVHEVALAHGGTATAETRDGGGMRFIFSVPLREDEAECDDEPRISQEESGSLSA